LHCLAICAVFGSCETEYPIAAFDADQLDDAQADTDTNSAADADSVSDADTDSNTDSDGDTDSGGPIENEWGFAMRLPKARTLTCVDPDENEYSWETEDADWICTFEHAGVQGILYVQNTPVECLYASSEQAVYAGTSAQMWMDGDLYTAHSPLYDWGGNHRNDFLDFQYQGVRFRYYHSSFGFGWRACQNMDCLQVLNEDLTVVEDGCTCDRTLPAVCARVGTDGAFGELVDTFEVCPGDETCG